MPPSPFDGPGPRTRATALCFLLAGAPACERPQTTGAAEAPPEARGSSERAAAASADPGAGAAKPAPPPAHLRELVERLRADEDPTLLSAQAPSLRRPSWDRLVLTLPDGGEVTFTDEVRERELHWTHLFRGSLAPLGAHIVERRYHPEGRQLFLIDARTGRSLEVDEVPVTSPDARRFVTASLDLVAGDLPNRIRIYRVTPAGPRLEWEAAPREWGARDPIWLDESTIRLERGVMDWDTHQLRTSPLVIHRAAAEWRLDPPRP